MKIKVHIIGAIAALLLSSSASAQWQQNDWQQTSGPNGGQVSSFASTGGGYLAVIGQGLYRHQRGYWEKVEDQWFGQLFSKGNVILSAHVEKAKVSTDGGYNWTNTVLPSTGIHIFGDHFYSPSGDSLYRSSDGINWTLHSRTPETTSSFFTHNGKFYVSSGWNGFLRSDDTGRTWTMLENQPPFSLAMKWVSSDDALYALPYPSGVFRTTDEGKTWEDMHYNLYEGTVFEGIAAIGEDVFVSDWLTTYQLKNNQWVEVPVAQIHASAIVNDKLLLATNTGLVSYSNGKFNSIAQGLYSNGVSTFGTVGNTLFARTNTALYRTQDEGMNWELNSTMYAMDIATAKGAAVVRGTSIMRTTDEGDTWQNLDEMLEDFVLYPTDLVSYEDDLYLASGLVSAGEHGVGAGWTTGGIFRSTDGGASWREISGNLPQNLWTTVPVYTIAAANDNVVIYTADGLFAANAGSSNWQRVAAPPIKYAIEIFSTGSSFMMLADSIWYASQDGRQWSEIVATAPADFMRNWEALVSYSVIRGVPYITTSQYERIDSVTWKTHYRNFKLENNAWQNITAAFPAGTVTSPMIEHKNALYGGTSNQGVWKLALPQLSVAPAVEPIEIAVFPNPATSVISLSKGSSSFRVTNLLGQDVTAMTDMMSEASIDVSRLPVGVYQITTELGKASFVKQ